MGPGRRDSFFKLAIGIVAFLPQSLWGQNSSFIPQATLKLRGTNLQLPFEIKILAKTFNPDQGVQVFSGHGLKWNNKVPISDGELKCSNHAEVFEKFKLLQDPINSSSGWICEAKGFKKRVTNIPTPLSVEAGFITVGENLFRGSLEVYTKDAKLWVINSLELEPYLAGLVNREIRSDFPPEAVKAQIVAARSYALATAADRRRRGNFYDLTATESDQVYDGSLFEDAQSHRMVRETEGEVLFHQEDILKAYYHSSNGGFTELPQWVWGDSEKKDKLAYLARASPWDESLTSSRWQVTLSPAMGSQIDKNFGKILGIKILSRTPGKRVDQIQVNGEYATKKFSGPEFRQLFGHRWIKSTYFQIQPLGKSFLIRGRGWGHGVGLSQLGAREMAYKKKQYKEILSFYYPYANVRKLELGESLSRPNPQNTPQLRAR